MELKLTVGERGRLWLRDTGLGSCSSGMDTLPVPDLGRVWWRALTCSRFLPTGAWVQVSPSPELQEGQAVVLSCKIPTETPEGTSYRWYRDGQPLQESTLATLHFAAITLSQAGAYHCQTQAPGSATASLAAPVSLHVSCKHFHPVLVAWRVKEPRSRLGGGDAEPLVWALPPRRQPQMRDYLTRS